jgi:hypothetical protein
MKKIFLPLFLLLWILSACQAQDAAPQKPLEGEPFAIYFVGDPQITGPDLRNYAIEKLPLSEVPILTTDDLVSYDWERHGMNLTKDAYLKIQSLFAAGMPSSGVPFVVVAYEQPIYSGAFWSPFSALSFDGIAVMHPLDPAGQTLYFELGYPNRDNFTGEDPRSNPRLLQALEDAEVIREEGNRD